MKSKNIRELRGVTFRGYQDTFVLCPQSHHECNDQSNGSSTKASCQQKTKLNPVKFQIQTNCKLANVSTRIEWLFNLIQSFLLEMMWQLLMGKTKRQN